MLQSTVSIVNTVLPLIGGIFIDAFGTIPGSILTTVLIAFGNILVAASTSSANLSMMIIGRFLYGIGSGTVVIAQETILSQWFQGRSLAAVIALMLSISRLVRNVEDNFMLKMHHLIIIFYLLVVLVFSTGNRSTNCKLVRVVWLRFLGKIKL